MDNIQNNKILNRLLSETLDIPQSEIRDDLNPGNCPNWDSFNNFALIAKLQDKFHVNFSLEEVQNMNSVKDIKQLLSKSGIVFLEKI